MMMPPVLRVLNNTVIVASKVHNKNTIALCPSAVLCMSCLSPTSSPLSAPFNSCNRCFHLVPPRNMLSSSTGTGMSQSNSATRLSADRASQSTVTATNFRQSATPILNRTLSAGAAARVLAPASTSARGRVSFPIWPRVPITTPTITLQAASVRGKGSLLPKRRHEEEGASAVALPSKYFAGAMEATSQLIGLNEMGIPSTTLGNIQRTLADQGEQRNMTVERPQWKANVWRADKLCNRRWVLTDDGRKITSARRQRGMEFTMATYNVLAQNLLEENSYLYEHAERDWLAWEYRQKNLIAEITFYHPDILCCQEINERHYNEFFYPEMQKLGYQGAFKKRTRSMKDGCAIFFKTSAFECDAIVPVEYLKPDVPVLDRDNVALLLLLRPKTGGENAPKLCVATTHLLFNPRRGDVKLAQLMTLFAEIDQLAYRPAPENLSLASYNPVIFCGDLNMEPYSRLYEFVSQGSLYVDGLDVLSLSGQQGDSSYRAGAERRLPRKFLHANAGITDQSQFVNVFRHRSELAEKPDENCVIKAVPFTQGSGVVSHSFRLRSVYPHVIRDWKNSYQRNIREVTTCHGRASCTVDYIFYTGGRPRRSYSADCISTLNTAEADKQKRVSDFALDTIEEMGNPLYRSFLANPASSGSENPHDRLQLVSRLELISDSDMTRIGKLPNELISSDHMILAAKFMLKY